MGERSGGGGAAARATCCSSEMDGGWLSEGISKLEWVLAVGHWCVNGSPRHAG